MINDKKSFLDSITLSLYHKGIGKNNAKPNNIRKHSDVFNWDNINFSPTVYDYQKFGDDNEHINLKILKFYEEKTKIRYIYESQYGYDRDCEVNLLLLGKNHYTCIKDLTPLASLLC